MSGRLPSNDGQSTTDSVIHQSLSRRSFLKLAGLSGVTLGLGAGLGGLLAACGGSDIDDASSALPSGASGTGVVASGEKGDKVKIGFVAPITGALANFGIPDQYCLERWREYAANGVVCANGKTHPVEILLRDSQSDSNRSAQVAGDLINNSGIHLMMVASTPDTVTPTVEQCEAYGVPVVSTDCPWQTYLGANFKTGYKWSYHAFRGGEDMIAVVAAAVASVETNKVCGFHMPNDADGNFYAEVEPPALEAVGLKVVNAGLYEPHSEDYTSIISMYKKAGCESVVGLMPSADFTNFWKQCRQASFNPKVCFITKGVLFPTAVDSLGDIADGLLCDAWWHPAWPFKSSLTGETCQELADDFEKRTGFQATTPLIHYLVGEMAFGAMKNSTDPTDKEAMLAGLEKLKLDTSVAGPIDFTGEIPKPLGPGKTDYKIGPGRKAKNVWGTGQAGAQWLQMGGKWRFTQVLVDNSAAPFLTDDLIKPVKALPIV
jgi:branched-chain amino acid transport system substrate-binding protein